MRLQRYLGDTNTTVLLGLVKMRQLRVVPNHVCVAVNMFDELVAIRGNSLVDVLPVAARGRLV